MARSIPPQLAGDLSEQVFEQRWLELTGHPPARLDPDREAFDYDSYLSLGGVTPSFTRLRFQVKSHLYDGKLPANATVRIKASHLNFWRGTHDPLYFIIVVAPREDVRQDLRSYKDIAKVFIHSAEHCLRDLDATDDGPEIRTVRVPLVCDLTTASVSLMAGILSAWSRYRSLVTGLIRTKSSPGVVRLLTLYLLDHDEISFEHKKLARQLESLNRYERRIAADLIAPLDAYTKALIVLRQMSVQSGNHVYLIDSSPLSEEIARLLFFTPTTKWIAQSRHWAAASNAKVRRTYIVPHLDQPGAEFRRNLLFASIVQNCSLGGQCALLPEEAFKERVERLVLPHGLLVESRIDRADNIWETNISTNARVRKIAEQHVQTLWHESQCQVLASKDIYAAAEYLKLPPSMRRACERGFIGTRDLSWYSALSPETTAFLDWPAGPATLVI